MTGQPVGGQRLPGKAVGTLIMLAVVWGAGMAVVKLGTAEMAPLFMAGVRSAVASLCLLVLMLVKGIRPFPGRLITAHGLVMGLLFGGEFALIYQGLTLTTASRVYVLIYTAPFFVALGAHFLLDQDRLNSRKVSGLLLAFAGVLVLFMDGQGSGGRTALVGDALVLGGGLLWGATTIYLKKYLVQRIEPSQSLFFQTVFSAPILFALSLFLEDQWVRDFSWVGAFSLFYQCIIVVFFSYLVWFHLVHRYPVSLLHSFTFLTPVVGVLLSGVLILGEPVGLKILAALVLVCLGLVQINR